MKLSLRQLDFQQMNVARQRVVHFPAQRLGGNRRDDVEVRDLFERMHAGVGPPRAVQLELILSGHFGDDARQLALHRPRVFLDLPAAVLRAGVFDEDFEASHSEPNGLEPEP